MCSEAILFNRGGLVIKDTPRQVGYAYERLLQRDRSSGEGPVYAIGNGTRKARRADAEILETFITNGGIDENTLGDVFIVYARTGEREISSFLVEKGMAGFRLGQKWVDKLGMRASFTSELVFENVRVPSANRIGEEGEGTLHMMRNLEIERLTLAATEGKIQLALRNPLDLESPATPGIRPSLLLGTAPPPRPRAARRRPAPPPPPAVAVAVPEAPTVEIIRGDKREQEIVR